MSAATCDVCRRLVRTLKPPQHLEGAQPDRFPLHRRNPGGGPICKGSGRLVKLRPDTGEAS